MPDALPSPSAATTARSAAARALLRRVELVVARQLDGLLQGERRGRRPGPGSEPALTRPYEPGDDVRWVDWRLSARTDDIQVRVPEIEPVLTAWALVDASASMAFGSNVRTKLDLGREVLVGLGLILARRSDRLGLVVTTGEGLPAVHPPRADRRGLLRLLAQFDGDITAPTGARTDLAGAVNAIGQIARHRGLVAIISDFPNQPGLERAIGSLSRRHEVLAIEIRDRRERELPALGSMRLRDVETGGTVLVDTSDPRFRERFASAVAADGAARRAMLARAGARHLVLTADEDWVLPLVGALRRRNLKRAA